MAVDWSQFKPLAPTFVQPEPLKPAAGAVDWSKFQTVEATAPAAGPVASQLRTSENVDRSFGEAAVDTFTGVGQQALGSISGLTRAFNDRAPGAAEAEREGGFFAGLLMDAGGKVAEAGFGAQRAFGSLIGDADMQASASRELEKMTARRAATPYEDLKRSDFAEGFAQQADDYAGRVPEVQSEKARMIAKEMGQLTQAEGFADQVIGTVDYFASPFLRGDLSTGGARVSKIMESLIPSLAAGGIAAKAVGAAGAGAGIQTAAQLGTMSVMEGGGAAEGARGEVLGTAIEDLQEAPEFQAALRMTGGDPIRARMLLADQAASISFGLGTAAAAGTMAVGQVFGANVAEQAVREGVGSLATGGGVRQALTGVASSTGKEFASEFVQGASNQAAQNVGTTATGASDSLGRGVVAAGIMEGIAGGGSGAAAQAAAEVSKRLRPIEDGEDLLGGSNVNTGEPGAGEPGGLNIPDDPDAPPITTAEVIAIRDQQLSALQAKASGRQDQTIVDPVTGKPVIVRGEPAQPLAEAEQQMLAFLQKYGDQPDKLARALGARLDDSVQPAAAQDIAPEQLDSPADIVPPTPVAEQSEAPGSTVVAPSGGTVAAALAPAPEDDTLLNEALSELATVDDESPIAAGPVAASTPTQGVTNERNEEAAPNGDPGQPVGQRASDGQADDGQAGVSADSSATGLNPIQSQPGAAAAPAASGNADAEPAEPESGGVGPFGQILSEMQQPRPAVSAGEIVDGNSVEGQPPAESTFAQDTGKAPKAESFIPQLIEEMGWSQKGGLMIRDPSTAIDPGERDDPTGQSGDVTDRTKWIGKPDAKGEESQFWRMRPHGSKGLSLKAAKNAIEKWRTGLRLGSAQQEFIDYLQKSAKEYAELWATENAEMQATIAEVEQEGLVEERAQILGLLGDVSAQDEREALAFDDLLRRARDAGATREQLVAIITETDGEPNQARALWYFIQNQEQASAADQGTEVEDGGLRDVEGSGGQAFADPAGETAERQKADPEQEPNQGLRLSAQAAPPVEQQAAPRASQGGLFAPPTRGEVIDGERKKRDDARDGKNATGRTDMMAGEGELFAGPRPEQVDVEQAIEAERDVVEAAAAAAAASPANDRPEPTEAQREAGNYKKGPLSLHGLRISIENPAGSRRRPEWPELAHHYGYIRGTEGKDGDHVDVFLGPDAENADLPVFVVDQVTQAGRFDEHKVMMGFADEAAARAGYLANYSPGWSGLGDITQMALGDFRAWVMDPVRTSKRASAVQPRQPSANSIFTEDAAEKARARLRAKLGRPNSGIDPYTFRKNGGWFLRADKLGDAKPAGNFSRPRSADPQTQTPEFKRWFGDSKVVDAEGRPLVVYHGSPDARFMAEDAAFKSQRERFGFGRQDGAYWFASDRRVAETYADDRRAFDYQNAEPAVIPAYLSMQNPLVIDARGEKWRDAQRRGKTSDVIAEARESGNDGVIIRNVRDDYQTGAVAGDKPTDTYVVFNSSQIKSSDQNRGTFDPADPRITFSQPQPGDRIPMGPLRSETAIRFAVAAALDGWNGQKPIVRVVKTSADLPADAKAGDGWKTAEGYFDGVNGVWLVTDNLSDPQRALEVLRHEAVGHFGVERIAATEWPAILAGVEAMRGQKRNSMSKPMAAALAEAEARYEAAASDDPLLFAKELLAVMSETGTRATWMDRMLSQLRTFLRKTGLIGEAFSEAELRSVLSGAFRLIERGGSLTAGAPVAAGGMQSIRPDDVAAYILRMMVQSDADLFRYPKSDSTSFAKVVKDVSKSAIAAVKLGGVEVNFTENLDDVLPAVKWGLRLPNGAQAFVYIEQPSAYTPDSGLRMFMDASGADAGASLGSAVYAGLFQWALNTGHTFIGDPNGLSTEALLRRTEHMLSAALKHGTTRMMAPHDRQVGPMSKKWGPSQDWAHPLQWTDGDDVGNLTALIRTSVENHRALLKGTEADGAAYRLSDGQFIGAGGQPLTDEGLRRAASTAGARFRASGRFAGPESRAAAVGGSTVARTLVLGTLLDGSTGSATQRRELLAQLAERLSSQRLTFDVARRVFYSRPAPGENPSGAGQGGARAAVLAARQRAQQLTSRETVDRLIYEVQDQFIDLKRIQAHIRESGGTVSDLNDAYLGEELYHSRVMARHERFMESELKPLLADLNAAGFTTEQFEQFLHARHAPEANAVLAERNPDQAKVDAERTRTDQAVKALRLQLQRAQNAGSSTRAIEQALSMAEEESAHWRRVQPFKGTDAERAMLSGMSDADAAAAIAALAPADRAKMDALAARVDAINAKTLDQLQRYGLMSREALDTWRQTYQFYVPLHRDEANPDSVSHPTGSGYSVRGDASKTRTGSAKAKVTHILAHIAMQREAAITRGEKNSVAKKLYVLAGQNPDPNLWTLDKAPTITAVDEATGTVRSMPDPTYRQRPNVVMVRIAGQDRAIVFNDRNPQALRLAESLKNLHVEDLHKLLGHTGNATRWLASVNTQYNPVFGVVNLIRDVQGGALQLSTTPLKGKELKVASRIPAMIRSIYRERRGKGSTSPEDARLQRLWDDMRMTGGVTGYRDLFRDPMERANAIEAELKKADRGVVNRAAHAVVDWLSDYNEAIENATRLAVYEQALAQGLTKERAASLAKNITVNFNRKGRQTRQLGALYAFFNAAVQGTTRMVETLNGPAGRAIMAGGVLAGFANTLVGLAVMGGDEWEKIPGFVKERAFIIPISGKDYITIPMPLGYNVFPNIGRIAAEMMSGTNETAAGSVGELLRIVTESFNPLGGGDLWQMATPTVADPVVALWRNKDWTGKPIYREDFSSLNPTPGFTRAKDSASMPAKVIAWSVNALSGGDDYEPGAYSPTPDQIDYILGQLTGGLGREILKAQTTLTAPFSDAELPAYKIPLVSRLYGNTRGQAGESERFYAAVRELNIVENRMKGMAKSGEDVDAYIASEPLTELVFMGTRSQSVVQRLRSAQRQATEAGDSEQAKAIGDQITEIMADLNREVREAKR